MAVTNDTKAAWPGGTVRISMPASVANDLNAFKKGIAALAEELGCRNCFSGVDCTFQMEREFVINEKLKVAPVPGASTGVAAAAIAAPSRGVTVTMPTEVNYDLKKILNAVDLIGRNLGRHWLSGGLAYCCSGFDITFGQELYFMVDNDGNLRRGR
jgi:radical SAM superfamily enzyme YgiQ (UPF0313 family)